MPHDQNDPSDDELAPNPYLRGPWFWTLLVLLVLFPVVAVLSFPPSANNAVPDDAASSTSVPSVPVEASASPSINPSAQAVAAEAIPGGELLTVSNENSLDYWASVVVKVLPEKNDALKVFIQGENPEEEAPKIQKTIVSKTAKKVCERFSEDLTDGKTKFALMDMNGKVYASNIDEDGSIDECVSPLVEEIEAEEKAKESEKAAEEKADQENENK